jgi:uncharacterized protein YdhG (YjbR/CyaY superfamily)
MAKAEPKDVDAYIAASPHEAQPMLLQLRQLIKTAAPKAEEKISYKMPFYQYQGRLIYFAGYKHHVSVYGAGSALDTYAKELKRYMAARSTIQLPVGEPLPVALIRKVVKAKVKENEAKAKAKA